MMTATTKPTAIPTIWFVLRPTDGGDGGKDAMGEDVARQVEEGVPITKREKKNNLVANRNDDTDRYIH